LLFISINLVLTVFLMK